MTEFKETPVAEGVVSEAQAVRPEEAESPEKKGKGLMERVKKVVDKAEALIRGDVAGGGKWN